MNDVADVLDQAAAGPLHTPSLYSCFLRALVSAKTEPHQTSEDDAQQSHAQNGNSVAGQEVTHMNATASNGTSYALAANGPLSEFQFDSEMGPVADMSTFPPTMAPNPSEDHLGMLTMDSILSASFWDSVLVPG